MKILAIDDSPTLRQFITRNLQKHSANYCITTAKDGEEGLALAEAEPPDLILLDFVLPGLKGDEVCRRLEGGGRTGRVPVVLMSSNTKDILRTEAECRNVVKSISKPFTPELLCATVSTLLRDISAEHNEKLQAEKAAAEALAAVPAAEPAEAALSTATGSRRIAFSGQTATFPLISALLALEQDALTGVLRLWIDGRELLVYASHGRLLCATTYDTGAYLGSQKRHFTSGILEEQEKTGCPAHLVLALREVLPLGEALTRIHSGGLALLAPAWTRPDTRFEFESLSVFPKWLAALPPYAGHLGEWAIESLRLVGEECQSAHAWGEPTGIPAYTRRGYERIQHIPLNDEEIAFASLVDSRRTLADIATALNWSVDAATRLLHRFLCLEIYDYWPASILRQNAK